MCPIRSRVCVGLKDDGDENVVVVGLLYKAERVTTGDNTCFVVDSP